MKLGIVAATFLVTALAAPALAVEAHHQGAGASSASAEQLTSGEVRRVDKDAKKITIKHGPITNLDMPPMTMVFQVKDPAVLDRVKAGDKVRFSADKIGGGYVVTNIEPVQ